MVKESTSIAEVCRKLGIISKGGNFRTIKKYISIYSIDTKHFQTRREQLQSLHKIKLIPLEEILVENSTYNNNFNLKKRLFSTGLKKNECEICGLPGVWNNLPIIMQLDHINGINNDNRLSNLRMLCPNCHSQTETFCGKHNSKKFKKQKEREENNGKTLLEQEAILRKRKVLERPCKEELVNYIKELGFTGTGLKYNVGGNTIKKWCLSYNISKYIKDYK